MELALTEALILAFGAMGAGIFMLIKGGTWTIDAAVYVAQHSGIPHLIVGLTIVAFGTSFPELVVSVLANLKGSAGIALGNVLGSNIANILLVVGATALFTVLKSTSRGIIKDLFMMLVTTGLLAFLLHYGEITRAPGAGMVALLVAYAMFQYRMARTGEIPVEDTEEHRYTSRLHAAGFLLLGLIAIAVGAEFLVNGAKVSASIIGVPEAVIALSIIAFGTSLPELATCIIAARKGHSEIVLGNIIGSNVFNILMILGVTALVKPIAAGSFAPQLAEIDIWLVLGVSLLFSLLLLVYNKITKPIGIVFLMGYMAYNAYIYLRYLDIGGGHG